MITQILDQIHKLFGKSFLAAAFIPSALFAAGVFILTQGLPAFQKFILGWVNNDWKGIIFQLVLLLVGIYLLAYILFGIRNWVHLIFQGEWGWPLSLIKGRFIRLQMYRMHRARRQRDARLNAMNPYYWAQNGFLPGAEEKTPKGYKIDDAVAEIRQLQARLAQKNRLNWNQYQELIGKAWLLNRYGAENETVTKLMQELAAEYQTKSELQDATHSLLQLALREWQDAYNEFHNYYPEEERWLRPTRLGNVLGSLEEYTYRRYAISFGDLWPRLALVLDDGTQQNIEDANTYYDFTVMMGLLALLLAGIAAAVEPRTTSEWLVILILLAACAMFYQLAVLAARSFAAQVQAAIDLNRLKLLETLKIKMPANPADEKEIWVDLRRFFAQGAAPTARVQYIYGKPEDTKEPEVRKTGKKRNPVS